VTINAFSKSYSMTGWRVGYAAGPREIIAALERHQSQSTSNACSIAQYAALAALRGDHGFVREMNLNFSRRVARAAEILSGVPAVSIAAPPDGAFYLFLKYDAAALARAATPVTSSVELVGMLLEKGGVAAVQGEAFGDESAFRISVAAADAVVEAGVTAIANVMRELMN
jgi:aspartate aminotransferase